MTWGNTTDRYGSLSIGMHWLMLLLMIAVYAAIELHDIAPKGSTLRANLKTSHFMLGLGVLALVTVRLATRAFAGPAPRIEPPIPVWQHRLAVAMHVVLYVFMIGMPLLGWFAVSAKGKPILFFGMQLPALIGQDKALYDSLKEIHKTIGTVGYYLIGLHTTAALFHHYVMRDNTLLRILPTQRGSSSRSQHRSFHTLDNNTGQ
ncbi:cytochrome b [Aquamicrobium sp.]|uniref:cytochrome b n=1 Tax=Aquamicrobium sp. TaxID=1872579 RepID=UPI00258412DC|nr:cytochrome b [Aquamicrobium sp.]MCK9553745.1 cytochrome b [Aquamicrobium sp.]